MQKGLIAQLRKDIVGEWRAELAGVDLLYLEKSAGKYLFVLKTRTDGTAGYEFRLPGSPPPSQEAAAPFPIKWELSDDRVLSIWLPHAPMPDYGMPDWFREEHAYDVLAVTDISLTLSDRRFDGETVTVMRRVDYEDHIRRKYLNGSRNEAIDGGKR